MGRAYRQRVLGPERRRPYIERWVAMLDQINALIRENDICVLATAGEQGPHTSLMAYACSTDCSRIYLVTPRQTQKYRNLCVQPRVSLMVDTREQAPRGSVRALTINGRGYEISDAAESASVRKVFSQRHAHLLPLLEQNDIAFFSVVIEALQLLNGPCEAHYIRLPVTHGG